MLGKHVGPGFIPLGYDSLGRVVDVLGYIRRVEAIPYALDNVFVHVEIDGNPWEISREILGQVKKLLKANLEKYSKKILKKRWVLF